MAYQGHFENGMVVLDEPVSLPEGTKVRVELLPTNGDQSTPQGERRSLNERYKSIIGAAHGLPEDFAAEHDHYIHGTPKRSQ